MALLRERGDDGDFLFFGSAILIRARVLEDQLRLLDLEVDSSQTAHGDVFVHFDAVLGGLLHHERT